jgi:hypothetical protein
MLQHIFVKKTGFCGDDETFWLGKNEQEACRPHRSATPMPQTSELLGILMGDFTLLFFQQHFSSSNERY